MRIIKAKDYEEMSVRAAEIISAQVTMKPTCVLGLATGSTPIGTYQHIVGKCKKGEVDFRNVCTLNLDEYVGLAPDHDQSYAYFMNHNLFDLIDIDKDNTNIPNGLNPDEAAECARYDHLIQDFGGIDLQLIGLGPNGHIGFNEPSDGFSKGTNKVELTEATIQANKRFFEREEDVPRYAYTMGIRDIMQARTVLLVVNGESKARILKEALTGPITPQVPASILQYHNDFIVVADREALKALD